MNESLEAIARRTELIRREGDYMQDGLLYCGVCKEPKQNVYTLPNGKKIVPAILCRCQREERNNERQNVINAKKQARREELTKGIVKTSKFAECTLDNDDNRQPEVTVFVKKYVKAFQEVRKRGFGIMFYGADNGKGKSFYALCIANALIDRGYPVLFGTLNHLVMNRINAMHGTEDYISVTDYDMVIIDDLGVENASPTAFSIIDEVYANKIPLIVTTNLTPSVMVGNKEIEKRRIYDRLLEACTQKIHVQNDGSRLKQGNNDLKAMLELLG